MRVEFVLLSLLCLYYETVNKRRAGKRIHQYVSRHLRFEDTKGIMSPEMVPKSFGTSEKRASGLSCLRN